MWLAFFSRLFPCHFYQYNYEVVILFAWHLVLAQERAKEGTGGSVPGPPKL